MFYFFDLKQLVIPPVTCKNFIARISRKGYCNLLSCKPADKHGWNGRAVTKRLIIIIGQCGNYFLRLFYRAIIFIVVGTQVSGNFFGIYSFIILIFLKANGKGFYFIHTVFLQYGSNQRTIISPT